MQNGAGAEEGGLSQAPAEIDFKTYWEAGKMAMVEMNQKGRSRSDNKTTLLCHEPFSDNYPEPYAHVFYRVVFTPNRTTEVSGNLCVERYVVTQDAIKKGLQAIHTRPLEYRDEIRKLESKIETLEKQIKDLSVDSEAEHRREEMRELVLKPSRQIEDNKRKIQGLKKTLERMNIDTMKERDKHVNVLCSVTSVAIMISADVSLCAACGARNDPSPLAPQEAEVEEQQPQKNPLKFPLVELQCKIPTWLHKLLPSAERPLFGRIPHEFILDLTKDNSEVDITRETAHQPRGWKRTRRIDAQVLWSAHDGERRLIQIPLPHLLANVFACVRPKEQKEAHRYVIAMAPVELEQEDGQPMKSRTWRQVGAMDLGKGEILALCAVPGDHRDLLVLYKRPTKGIPGQPPNFEARFDVFDPSSEQFTGPPEELRDKKIELHISRVDKMVWVQDRIIVFGKNHEGRSFVARTFPGQDLAGDVRFVKRMGSDPTSGYVIVANYGNMAILCGKKNLGLMYSFKKGKFRRFTKISQRGIIDPAAVVVNDTNIVIFGKEKTYQYLHDPLSTWTEVESSSGTKPGSAAFVFKDKIYVFGGENNLNVGSTWQLHEGRLESSTNPEPYIPVMLEEDPEKEFITHTLHFAHPVVRF